MADYSIRKDDPTHQGYVVYAAIMAVLYCFGIPAASWCALHAKKDEIQKLQLLFESVEELQKGGTSMNDTNNKSESQSQRRKSLMHQDLVSTATRRFSGVGLDLNEAAGVTLQANLLKLEVSMKEEDPWLAGLSPLYKDYDFAHWWFEVFLFPTIVPIHCLRHCHCSCVVCHFATIITVSGIYTTVVNHNH